MHTFTVKHIGTDAQYRTIRAANITAAIKRAAGMGRRKCGVWAEGNGTWAVTVPVKGETTRRIVARVAIWYRVAV